jgi:hypothetical protein
MICIMLCVEDNLKLLLSPVLYEPYKASIAHLSKSRKWTFWYSDKKLQIEVESTWSSPSYHRTADFSYLHYITVKLKQWDI